LDDGRGLASFAKLSKTRLRVWHKSIRECGSGRGDGGGNAGLHHSNRALRHLMPCLPRVALGIVISVDSSSSWRRKEAREILRATASAIAAGIASHPQQSFSAHVVIFLPRPKLLERRARRK